MSALVVTAPSRSLRRALGPTAWAVLEDVALDAVADREGSLVAATNVRRLAANVGVSKDAAARALAHLVAAGVVVRLPARRSADGTFGPIAYRLCPDGLDGVGVEGAPVTAAVDDAPRPSRRQGRARPTGDSAQAALFELVAVPR